MVFGHTILHGQHARSIPERRLRTFLVEQLAYKISWGNWAWSGLEDLIRAGGTDAWDVLKIAIRKVASHAMTEPGQVDWDEPCETEDCEFHVHKDTSMCLRPSLIESFVRHGPPQSIKVQLVG
jgi:hypothetical protein